MGMRMMMVVVVMMVVIMAVPHGPWRVLYRPLAIEQRRIAQFGILLLQPRLALNAMAPVVQRFGIAAVGIIPACRPCGATRPGIDPATDGEGRNYALRPHAATDGASLRTGCLKRALEQPREDRVALLASILVDGHGAYPHCAK